MRWLAVAIALLMAAVPVWAEGIEFEDDFDTYGTGIECASDPDTDLFKAIAAWPAADGCSSLDVRDDYYGTCPSGFYGWDSPFSVKHGKLSLRRNVKDLVPIIQTLHPGMNAVNGSDAEPLVLSVFVFMSQFYVNACETTFWIELFASGDPAPNDQNLIHNNCVLTNETPSNPHRSIAFGGYPESVPCEECPDLGECPEPDDLPRLYADMIYDGDHWTILYKDVPVPGPQLRPSHYWSWWTITIESNTVDITVYSDRNGVVTRTGIPRAYTGAFQAIGLGPCEASDFWTYIDRVNLSGGFLTTQGTGACCLVDGSCNDGVVESVCNAQNGTWKDEDSTCATVTCCPKPWADIDFDGDVDQTDFAMWQRCFSGSGQDAVSECECYDRDDDTGAQEGGDGDVDVDDFAWFANCFMGPTVWLDPDDPPPGCIPGVDPPG